MPHHLRSRPILPDPFVAELRRIPGFLELTTGFTLCSECERCERSLVYLTQAEQTAARRAGIRLYGTGGATRWNRSGCKCPFYDQASFGCEIYANRPLICNLFPLDLIEHEDDYTCWWVAYGACEEVKRGKLAGRLADLTTLAREIDRRMPLELKRAFLDDTPGTVFEPEFYRHPVHYLFEVPRPGDGD
jgi:Fe-S-cluster containining protein